MFFTGFCKLLRSQCSILNTEVSRSGKIPESIVSVSRDAPEGLGVQTSVMGQHGGQSVLQHQQTAICLLLHGEKQADSTVEGCYGYRDEQSTTGNSILHLIKEKDISCTKPGDVLVVPCHSLPATGLQGSPARHPPEGVDVCPGVKVGSPQETHSSKTLFSCVQRANGM